MRNLYWVSVLMFCFVSLATGQRSDGSLPYSYAGILFSEQDAPLVLERPKQQIYQIRSQASAEKFYDFGVALPVNENLLQTGTAQTLPNGYRLLRRTIHAPGAYGINLNFVRFQPGKSGKLWVYAADKQHYLGAFDYRSVNPGIPFATAPVRGETLIIEFLYDPSEAGIALELAEAVYEFEDIFSVQRGFGASGSCNRNINCPEYASKSNQKRSVAMILTSNNVRWCSGAMINNTAQDGKPYFLTARHCNTSPNSIFMFNYESPDCSNLDASTDKTIQGCTILVNYAPSDVTLLELSSPPPASFFTYHAGWNAGSAAPDSTYSIHHPRGDIKKISFDDDPSTGSPYSGGDTALNHWKIANWEVGTTEVGSSGSPLFNQQNQIIGQLHGGQANCANSINDYYGKLAYSWVAENTPETAVRFWLDPLNSGLTQMNGQDYNAPENDYDMAITALSGSDSVSCASALDLLVTVRNTGALSVTGFKVTVFKNDTELASQALSGIWSFGETETILFPGIALDFGSTEFRAELELITPQADQDSLNNTWSRTITRIKGDEVNVNFKFDLFSSETKWFIFETDGTSVYQSPSASAYEEMNVNLCLPEGCYLFRVSDAGSDGICCQGGEGRFEIRGSNGEVLVPYEAFTDLFETKFCVPGLPEDWEELFQIYPNPSTSQINVKLQSYAEGYEGEILIFSVDGKVMQRESGTLKYLNTFDVSEWAQGVYFIRVRVGKLKSVQKFIKN